MEYEPKSTYFECEFGWRVVLMIDLYTCAVDPAGLASVLCHPARGAEQLQVEQEEQEGDRPQHCCFHKQVFSVTIGFFSDCNKGSTMCLSGRSKRS